MSAEVVKIDLNKEQEEAANHVYGPAFVSARPGSGKTRVIVERSARIAENEILPHYILCITFTNKAANEMKERLRERIGISADEMYISTFHALCANILRKYGHKIGYVDGMSILDSDDQESVMAQVARQLGYDFKKAKIKNICSRTNNARENLLQGIDFDNYFENDIEDLHVAKEYLNRISKSNQIDFSGLLSETVRLLNTDSEVLSKLQNRFKIIQVDEAQDCNIAQFEFIRLIGAHKNVMIIGDIDQSIYKWRGARHQNIDDFIKEYDAKIIEFPLNYRSTPQILARAESLIRKNEGRDQVSIKTENSDGAPVEFWQPENPQYEAQWMASRINQLIYENGYDPEDCAVLYRMNSQSQPIETAFFTSGISYNIIGSRGFYDRSEVKDVLAMLKFYANPYDGTALSRFINKPSRSIGNVTFGKIENYAINNDMSVLEAMYHADEALGNAPKKSDLVEKIMKIHDIFAGPYQHLDIGQIANEFIEQTNYTDYLRKKYPEDFLDKEQNITQLVDSASLFAKQSSNDIQQYLNKICLMSISDKESEEGAVTLMTMHAAKGLEFPVVFLPSVEEGILPHSRSMMENEDIDEERRLCYVAMTRAKERLIISKCYNRFVRRDRNLEKVKSKPSRFLFEASILEEKNE